MVTRLTRIYFRNRFFQYPLQVRNVLSNLGIMEAVSCCLSYLKSKFRPGEKGQLTFEDWVVDRFGRRLFELFFRTYSEKLWGIPCRELDADFAAQRIRKFSLYEAVRSALFRRGGGRVHKTLVDEFAYPHGGSGVPYERMAGGIRDAGGTIRLGTPVQGIWTDGSHRVLGVTMPDSSTVPYDHVISSIPLTLAVASLREVPASVLNAVNQLRFRNTILVYLLLRGTDYFKDQWLYIHEPSIKAGRITNFRNWVPHLYGDSPDTILTLEYWCNFEDPVWKGSDDQLIECARSDLARAMPQCASQIADAKVIRVPRCYPVYSLGYRDHVASIRSFLQKFDNLQVIGRYGSFKYNNQDHSILMGWLAAENVACDAGHDLWRVNTDDEYQESMAIPDLLGQPSKNSNLSDAVWC